MTNLIEDLHPRIYERLHRRTDDPKKNVEEFFKVIEDLQDRKNWKRYRRMIPKVVRFFRESERVAEEVSKDHNVKVEFWLNPNRCGIQVVVDTEGMDEDRKLQAIMKAAMALKDFDERFRPIEGF